MTDQASSTLPSIPPASTTATASADLHRQATLVDLVDRILEKGAVVRGQLVLAVADVELVRVDLSLLLGSVDAFEAGAR